MVGPTLVKGTWALALVAVLPVLVSQIAAAAPGYPVEDPPAARIVVGYDPQANLLTISTDGMNTTEGTSAKDPSDPVEQVEIASGAVEGPNGQINHGQVMKQLHELTDGDSSGCLTSAVAKSDLGKPDQRVETEDTDVTLVDTECTTADLLDEKAPTKGSATSLINQSKDHGKSSGGDDADKGKDKDE